MLRRLIVRVKWQSYELVASLNLEQIAPAHFLAETTRDIHDSSIATNRKRLMLDEVAIATTLRPQMIKENEIFDEVARQDTYVFFQPL